MFVAGQPQGGLATGKAALATEAQPVHRPHPLPQWPPASVPGTPPCVLRLFFSLVTRGQHWSTGLCSLWLQCCFAKLLSSCLSHRVSVATLLSCRIVKAHLMLSVFLFGGHPHHPILAGSFFIYVCVFIYLDL